MDMRQVAQGLSDHSPQDFLTGAMKLLARDQRESAFAGDACYQHSPGTLDELYAMSYAEVQGRYIRQGTTFTTVEEVKRNLFTKITKAAGDAFVNPVNGIGTWEDPQRYVQSTMPIMMGPMEASSWYATGGLQATIIDKKSYGMVGDGATFKSVTDDFWKHDKVVKLEEAAEVTKLNKYLSETVRDALIFGGAALYPVFKNDSIATFERSMQYVSQKDCIERWCSVDRWNMVFVPSFNVTAADYLHPRSVYMPLGGYTVNTDRMALLVPKSMPYWATMANLGWSPSDFTSFIRAYLAYQIIQMAVPIMAQQMSLLLYQLPLDAVNATISPEMVKKVMQLNEEKMKEWSVLHPKAVNMVGELKVIERTFSGFDQFVGSIKSDLAAQSDIPEPTLFHTPNKGFSDNTQESLLKASETMKVRQQWIEGQLRNITEALIIHTFGRFSPEYDNKDTLFLTFDKPIVSTEKDNAEVGARFAAAVASMVQANIPPAEALKIAQLFFKNVRISDDVFGAIEENFKRVTDIEKEALEVKKASGTGPGVGKGANTGKATKPA